MSDGFSLDRLKDGVQSAQDKSKNLCPWLPDPKVCEECGSYCTATTEYVETQAMPVDVWKCPECMQRYYRGRV